MDSKSPPSRRVNDLARFMRMWSKSRTAFSDSRFLINATCAYTQEEVEMATLPSEEAKCQHCLSGHLHEGIPQNGVHTLAGAPCYVAPGNKADTAVLICTDVFGYDFPNTKLLADEMARTTGITVYVPDILKGEAINLNGYDWGKFPEWRSRHGPDVTLPIVEACIAELRTKHGIKKLGIQGYCFGGKYCALVAGAGLVEAYGVAHPSFVSVEEFAACKCPAFFACAETDQQFPLPMAEETQKVLEGAGVACEFRRYPGTTHGFAVRGNLEDPVVEKAKTDALQGLSAFFSKYLA